MRWKIPFFSGFLLLSLVGVSGDGGGVFVCRPAAACRAARRATESAGTWPSPWEPVIVGAPLPAAGAGGGVVSQPEFVVTPPRPPCSGQTPTGSVPAMYTSVRVLGQVGVAGMPDSGSMVIETMPAGALNGFASRYSR